MLCGLLYKIRKKWSTILYVNHGFPWIEQESQCTKNME
jgi:hypothetical protein